MRTAAIGSLLLLTPGLALAGGVELPGAGTTALGRGGALHARPGGAMALLYNPANLSAEPGLQLSLQTHVILNDSCFNRSGSYIEYGEPQEHDLHRGVSDAIETVDAIQRDQASAFNIPEFEGGTYPRNELPRVCDSGPPGIVPELVLSWRVHPKVGLGVGFIAPAAVGHTVWGDSITVGDRRYQGTTNGLPAPTRYSLIEEQLVIAFPTVGIGVAVHPRFRLGMAFGFGFGLFEFVNVTRAVRGESFGNDIHTTLNATDRFIPRVTLSAHATPHARVDLSVTYTWTDDIDADGDVRLQSGYYRAEVLEDLTIPKSQLSAPQPWHLAFGIRYAHPAGGTNESEVKDPMSVERFDIEFDLVYERNSRVDDFGVRLPTNPERDDGQWFIQADTGIPAAIPQTLVLAHGWKDSVSLRLGGDWNVVPGRAAVRLGLSHETKGVRRGFEQLDFMPFQRTGLHLGGTLRFGRFDVSLAYAHIWQRSVTVSQGQLHQINADHRTAEITCDGDAACSALDADERRVRTAEDSNFGEGTIINAGKFTSSMHLVSLGLTYHFQ